MRAPAFLIFCLFATLSSASAASSPKEVRAVYLLPMPLGMDQYLANRLTNEGVYEVVTDILRADAVISGSVGKGFEVQLEDMLQLAEERKAAEVEKQAAEAAKLAPATSTAGEAPEAEENAEKDAKPEEKKEAKKEDSREDRAPGNASSRRVIISTFGRGKGTVFLVDLASRKVLWSTYAVPKNDTSKELDKTASAVVDRLRSSLAPAN